MFDKRLRLLAMDALERIEIALRVDISHTWGQSDAFAYLKPDLFHASFAAELDQRSGLTRHHEWLHKHASLINRSKEEFMRHNKEKYGLPVALTAKEAGMCASLLSLKILLALSIVGHYLAIALLLRRGRLDARRSQRLHLAILLQMGLILVLAKAMLYLSW